MFGAGDTAERGFVREALLALGTERPGLRDAARAVRNWDRVVAIAEAGSVAESIGSAVSLRGVEDAIPEPQRTAFRDAHAGATARNALLLSDAAEVQGAFAAAGIESVILKGPGLLVAHYPDIGARHVSDVDILVRWADSDRADGAVRALGGKPKRDLLIPMEEGKGGHRHLTPLVTPRGVIIEIHGRLPGAATSDAAVGDLIGRSRDVSWQMRALRIPSEPDLAAMICLHVFDYHGGLDEYVLRHLADLAVLMGKGTTRWNEVEARVESGVSQAAVDASRRLLEEGGTGFAAWRHVIGVRARGWAHLAARPEPGVLMTVVFPPRSFMANRYGVAPDSRLLPLLYLWRPVRGAWRFVTGR
jgi:hypothetical protein